MHIYFNAFKHRIALRSSHKARKNKTESLKIIGIVLVLGLYWYCLFRMLYCIGIGIGEIKPVLFICVAVLFASFSILIMENSYTSILVHGLLHAL